MHNFEANYDKLLEVLNTLEPRNNYFKQIRKPKLSDKELISIALTAEYLGVESELQLFRVLPFNLSSKIERTVYNRRRRKLFPFIEEIRLQIVHRFNEFESYYIIDSMPLEICKLSRANRSRICCENNLESPDRGFCASQNMKYYGYKLHAVCSVNGIIETFDLSKASIHDIHYLKDVKNQMNNCTIIGDKGYLSNLYQLDLFEERNIILDTPMRKNQQNYKEQASIFRKSRKRIETLFSQLCDQFQIRRNYTKSFQGLKARILSKITAFTVIQYINKFVYNRDINKVKINIT